MAECRTMRLTAGCSRPAGARRAASSAQQHLHLSQGRAQQRQEAL
jgi:hypothetical protein